MTTEPIVSRLLRRGVDVQRSEVPAVVTAALYFFFLLSSYFILRPIRDTTAVAAGVQNLPWLFAGTLGAMLMANPVFSAILGRFGVKRCVVATYHFFVVGLVLFFLAERSGADEVWTGRLFWVWSSVFSLYGPSIFWALMADTFRSGDAKRLFAVIGIGGTLGSIAGSTTTVLLARALGPVNLLLVSAVLLEIATICAALFMRTTARRSMAAAQAMPDVSATPDVRVPRVVDRDRAIGGSMWAGITHVVRDRYLGGISAFLVLYSLGSTVLYFAQISIVGATYAEPAARTEILARIELAVQVLTVLTQLFLTSRVIRAIGLSWALALLPALGIAGFAAIGASAWVSVPVLAIFVVFHVLRRGTNFAIMNPAMEVLFTVVPREDKYKAKSFIETFVYRAGDQLGAWGYAGLTTLGLALTGIAWIAVPVSATMLGVALWLGRRQQELAKAAGAEVSAT